MRVSILLLLALCIAHGNSQGFLGNIVNGALNAVGGVVNGITGSNKDVCNRNVYQDFRKSQTALYTNLYKHVASQKHFGFSPSSIWLTLSALAEGADPSIQGHLFNFLVLPQEVCLRKKYYDMALNIERSSRDVSLIRKRELVLDQSLTVNSAWGNLMRTLGLLDVSFAPIKSNPAGASQQLRQTISARSNIVLSGNSILLDSLNYQGLWTTAFPAASVRPEPFYNNQGQQIGVVNMMRMKKRVRLAHFGDTKALELPVGVDGRYIMRFTIGIGTNLNQNPIELLMGPALRIFSMLKMSLVPIEIAVPQFEMTSEFDARPILEESGVGAFFSDPAATSFVSQPAALPGSFIQRVTISVGPNGVNPSPITEAKDPITGFFQIAENTATGLAAVIGREFIANKPFLYGLFDAKTDTCLFAGAYSRP